MDEVDGSVRSAIGLLGLGSLFYAPSKEIEADALMAPLTISVRFQARKISWRHLIVPRFWRVTTPEQSRLSFQSVFPSLVKLSLPDRTFAFSPLFAGTAPITTDTSNNGIPFND